MTANVRLTLQEMELAKMMGYTPQEYGRNKIQLEGARSECKVIAAWLRKHGYEQIARAIENGEHYDG